ncbi:hypothetical protein F4861DRAFT_542337 [Xylaria intraflava]|nr:hypothetical protein F4861DRAFT_542337 [Xylaria intraflava]
MASTLGKATKAISPRTCADILYRPKKIWPPDFSKLSRKEQFRLEKRHKRRIKLATSQPRWHQYAKLAQLGTMTVVLVYIVLFMEWDTKTQPFEGVRNIFWNAFGASGKPHERRQPAPSTTAD